MAREFFLADFLRQIDVEVFNQYLESKSIPAITATDNDENNVQAMVKAVESASGDTKEQIVQELMVVRELATEGGVNAINEVAKDKELIELLSKQENNQNRALVCLVKNPKVFDFALTLKTLVSTTNFYTRNGLKKVSAKEVLKRKKTLELELQSYLQSNEGRGANCQIDIYQFSDRVCFIAYSEDHPNTYLFFENTSLKRQVHTPSFQTTFVYYPEDGVIQLSTRAGYQKRQKLFDLFNLNKILDPEFTLATEPEDQIEAVFLSQIRFDYKYNNKRRTIVQIDEGEGLETMFKEMSFRNLSAKSLQYFDVYQATFKFRFKQFGRSNRVTMQLTMPDRDGLDETEPKQLARKYIEKWGLINDEDSETS